MGISVCYIDEAGCTGVLPTANSNIQPALIISALIVDLDNVKRLTNEFIDLKVKYYPGIFSRLHHDLDALTIEIKGSDIRKDLRDRGNRGKYQHRQRFIDDLFSLLQSLDAKLISRIWIKGIGTPFDGRAIYTITTQKIAELFQDYLAQRDNQGIMIGDFRDPRRNSFISHSVFTQKYKRGHRGDAFPNLIETPTFGISDNHAGLQVVDVLTSAILYPIATHVYCNRYVRNVHVNPNDKEIWTRYKKRIKAVQYSANLHGKRYYGVTVNDPHANRTSLEIFR